ncbi:MAG: hypothetical protein PHI71_17285 [Acidiphilium sp.]|jgi:flagellar biogenesis protein FliO|uniref:Uncharacterized protein n=1 Tax=Acidiphilium acidophilum TaxID=76588 RepID=A0AAW9DVG8_ACIAO|nr:hypothetical protein [Acidiphilium acidophilum]MDD2862801.1 hypothetical protein [Acidiphilium sp.]MDX5932871.1 hypothetical protein [Acidiphilium acidophilum]MEE3500018.1 hypothetical protein [Acidiphilium acidophilum]GBR76186.1 hypothetical protein AA700_0551 [Acidiphilium acidophilum DSM 700]
MLQPTILNATLALAVMLGLITGLAWLIRRLGLIALLDRAGTPRRIAGRVSLALDKGRRLSIVEVEGWRFAVLTGGRSDQLLMLEAPARKESV